MSPAPDTRDVVVIGASAGGVEALMRVVGGLPADFGAAVFVVLHIPPDVPSALDVILRRAGRLPVLHPEDQQPIVPGHVYVAPPNRHLIVQNGHVAVQPGPRENGARPSVDVLFRSAARAYGRRVVGVVLSGTLRDGALGLATIKMRGGVTIVQDPDEALFRGMPESALRTAPVDYCIPAAEIARQLAELTQHQVDHEPMERTDADEQERSVHAADEPHEQASPKRANHASGLTCPECHGSLWELKDNDSLRFECRVGHTYGLDALLAEQGAAVEAALWSAINVLQERAAALRRLGGSFPSSRQPEYADRAEMTESHARALLDLMGRLIDGNEVG